MLAVFIPALIAILGAGWSYYRARRHRQIGLSQALLAEMTVRVEHDKTSLHGWREAIEDRIVQKEKPFVTLGSKMDFLAGSVHSELHYLPGRVLKTLVHYRELEQSITESFAKIGSDEFMSLADSRKRGFADSIVKDVDDYLVVGDEAKRILERYVTARRKAGAWRDLFQDRWTDWE